MKTEELEAKVRILESQVKESKNVIQALGKKVGILQDMEDIKKLQRSYGYYIEHFMAQELIDLFADGPDTAVHFIGMGSFLGKDGVKRCFEFHPEAPGFNPGPSPELLHQTLMLSPIVNVAPEGKTAQGRWYGLGNIAVPIGNQGVMQTAFLGLYECDYIKQDGKWKIKVLRLAFIYGYPVTEGFVRKERLLELSGPQSSIQGIKYDSPPDIGFEQFSGVEYPSGYILPFHFKHPVTGKETSEKSWNATLKGFKSR